jgi:hypothetical protein
MYIDELPSVGIADLRRSGELTPGMECVAVTLQETADAPVSTEVGVVHVLMRSGGFFLQFICGHCGQRAQVLRLYAGQIMCGRCTGLRYWCEGKPAVRRAQHRIERLEATRFHGVHSHAARDSQWSVAPNLRRRYVGTTHQLSAQVFGAIHVWYHDTTHDGGA